MVELPKGMLRGDRKEDQHFQPNEYLYRRVPYELWDDSDEDIEADAIELPDMSVMWSKYAHPEWARFDRGEYVELGVVGFRIDEIPQPFLHLGVFHMTFRAEHVPLKKNYPHAEVRAYENDTHVDGKNRMLDPDMHLRWREHLVRKLKKVVYPHQDVEIREDAPPLA